MKQEAGNHPSPEYLKTRLNYKAETGELYWKERPLEHFGLETTQSKHLQKVWNSRFAGKLAGRVIDKNCGRRGVRIDGRDYISTRVIWALTHSCWPSGDVDHINGDPSDDRICNLRDVARTINNRNRKATVGASGYVGVTLHKRSGLWQARMHLNNQKVSLGYFKTAEEAFAARLSAQQGHGFTQRHTGQ